MSSSVPENGSGKPILHSARSFPRMDTSEPSPLARSRAKTVQSVAVTETVGSDALPVPLATADEDQDVGPDVFEKTSSPDGDDTQQSEDASVLSRNALDPLEELPIELISLTDRYGRLLTSRRDVIPPRTDISVR